MLGAHNVRSASEPGRIEMNATEYSVHPNWNSYTLRNDVALIKLPKPVTFNGISILPILFTFVCIFILVLFFNHTIIIIDLL